MQDKLQKVLPFLFYHEPFFADIFRFLNKVPSTSISLVAIAINENAEIDFLYNIEELNKKSISELYFLIKHEVYHIMLDHVFGRYKVPQKLWNYATDIVVNNLAKDEILLLEQKLLNSKAETFNINYLDIKKLYNNLVTSENVAELLCNMCDEDMNLMERITLVIFGCKKTNLFTKTIVIYLNKCSSEQVYDFLNMFLPKKMWEEYEVQHFFGKEQSQSCDDLYKNLAKEKFIKQIEEAIKEGIARGYGTIPQHMRNIVTILCAKKEVDWKLLLNYFIKGTIRGHKYSTIRKINKRFAYLYAGIKHKKYAKILIGVDESGSMSNKLISELFLAIKGLSEIVQFDIVPFDVVVNESAKYTWKKGQALVKHVRTCSGGTSFEHISKYAKEKKYDGLIIVTDLEAPWSPPFIRRMWLAPERLAKKCYWKNSELVVGIKEK